MIILKDLKKAILGREEDLSQELVKKDLKSIAGFMSRSMGLLLFLIKKKAE